MEIKMSISQVHTLTVSVKNDEIRGKQNLQFPKGTVITLLILYIATKSKKRAEIPATTSSHLQLHTLITCNSGHDLAGNSELFPV